MQVFRRGPYHSTDDPPVHAIRTTEWKAQDRVAVVTKFFTAYCGAEHYIEKTGTYAEYQSKFKENLCRDCVKTFLKEKATPQSCEPVVQ